jgi:TolA-binding protein
LLSTHVLRILLVALVLGVAVAVFAFGGLGRVAGLVSQPSAATRTGSAPSRPGEQTVQITESELAQQLQQQVVGRPLGTTPMGTATLTRITSARLADGHLQADGDASVASTTVPVSLRASATAKDGRAIVSVDDLRAGGVPLPNSARDSVEQALQTEVDQQVDQLQLRVTSLTIGDGKLTLVGNRR